MNGFFIDQTAMYSAYHRDPRNRATHFIGIPTIVFSIFIPLSWVGLGEIAGQPVTAAWALWAVAGAFYLWLDLALGLAMVVVTFALLQAGQWAAGPSGSTGWIVCASAFIGGWTFQLIGHVFEGRRPALVDNLLQALIGPMFLVAETAFALGFKKPMHAAIEARWPHYSAAPSPASAKTIEK